MKLFSVILLGLALVGCTGSNDIVMVECNGQLIHDVTSASTTRDGTLLRTAKGVVVDMSPSVQCVIVKEMK